MFTIRKATTADCALIQKLAQQIFPVTYKDILTPEQTDYMMEWMYSVDNIRFLSGNPLHGVSAFPYVRKTAVPCCYGSHSIQSDMGRDVLP